MDANLGAAFCPARYHANCGRNICATVVVSGILVECFFLHAVSDYDVCANPFNRIRLFTTIWGAYDFVRINLVGGVDRIARGYLAQRDSFL